MNIYLIRHAEATHLKEDWHNEKISRADFINRIQAWDSATLTVKGKHDAEQIKQNIPPNISSVFSSPLLRSMETARHLLLPDKELILEDNLKEIVTNPLRLFAFKKFSTIFWIYFCIFSCFVNGFVFRVMRQSCKLFNQIKQSNHDVVMVSHAMRIRSLVYMSYLLPGIKTMKKDFTPCGITIIRIAD